MITENRVLRSLGVVWQACMPDTSEINFLGFCGYYQIMATNRKRIEFVGRLGMGRCGLFP